MFIGGKKIEETISEQKKVEMTKQESNWGLVDTQAVPAIFE